MPHTVKKTSAEATFQHGGEYRKSEPVVVKVGMTAFPRMEVIFWRLVY